MFKNHPVLGPAAKYLYDYMELINDNSDGWHSWRHGTICADTLGDILYKARMHRFRSYEPGYVEPTRQDVVKACKKIERFVLTNKYAQASHLVPPTLAAEVQLALY
jgi:hypothetical protein